MKGGEIMKALHIVSFTLVLVGALNWGLVGLFNFDLVAALLGTMPSISKIAYVLIGISAVIVAVTHKKDCNVCSGK